ncbi:MAG: glycosyltransferase [Ignavibacteriaceae bacterium]|nr:glycosyltransferase [Ignavibacteriaceae bacterium]
MDNNFKPLRYKILFLASWFPNRTSKVLGIFVQKKALAVSKMCNVAVLYVTPDIQLKGKNFDVECNNESGIITVRVYFKFLSSGVLRKILYNFSFVFAYYLGWKRIKKEWGNPDLIHVNVIDRAGYIALILKYIKKIRYVITEHSTPDINYLRGITPKTKMPLKFLKSIVIKNSEFMNVDSSASLEYYKKVGFKGNLGVIKNVVDIYPEYIVKKNRIRKDNIKRAVHISILNGRKNVADIIRAFDHICNKLNKKDIEFHLIGEGEQKDQLMSQAQECGLLNKNIFFHGFVDESTKLKILTDSDFHILNSDEEGFSVVTAEAILYGIPVIATKCGGPEDFVPKEVGILIERRNLQQLIDSILYMAENSHNYDPEVLQEFGKKEFSPDVICQKTYDVYKRVLKQWYAGNTKQIFSAEPDWKVIDIGSGHHPNRRANIILEKYMGETIHRTNQRVEIPEDKYLVIGDALYTPFKDKEFDFLIASHIGEHIDDPVKFCSELNRITKRGYIETPGPLTEMLLPSLAHKWVVTKNGNIFKFKANKWNRPFLPLFYSLFYLNQDNHDFKTLKSNNLIIKIINFLLNKIWRHIPYAYTKLIWSGQLSGKVLDN